MHSMWKEQSSNVTIKPRYLIRPQCLFVTETPFDVIVSVAVVVIADEI